MRKIILLTFVLFLLFSCRENKLPYEFLMFRENNIKMWPDTISENFKDNIENSKFSIKDEKGNLLVQGKFSHGLRTGPWVYHPSDTQTVRINWSSHIKDGVSINYPLNWTFIESAERPVQFSFPLKKNEQKKGKYFIVLSHNKDSIGMGLEKYFRYYQNTMFESEKIKEYAFFELVTTANKTFYFSRFLLERNGESILILSFLGEIGSSIYDITYSSLNEEYEKKHIVFFDMLRSLVLGRQRFFSPFDPTNKFKQLEKPGKEKPPLPIV